MCIHHIVDMHEETPFSHSTKQRADRYNLKQLRTCICSPNKNEIHMIQAVVVNIVQSSTDVEKTGTIFLSFLQQMNWWKLRLQEEANWTDSRDLTFRYFRHDRDIVINCSLVEEWRNHNTGKVWRSLGCCAETITVQSTNAIYPHQLWQETAVSIGWVIDVQRKDQHSHYRTNLNEVLQKLFQPMPIAGVAQVGALVLRRRYAAACWKRRQIDDGPQRRMTHNPTPVYTHLVHWQKRSNIRSISTNNARIFNSCTALNSSTRD